MAQGEEGRSVRPAGGRRPVRSYVLRSGRMTAAQRRALDELWDRYGVEPDGVLDLGALFARKAPVYVEVGFGMGDVLLELALKHPERNYLGIEVHPPGIGRLLARLAREGLSNVRVVNGDAAVVFADHLPPGSLNGVYVLFPDPWPKKRHHKRRLVQAEFLSLVASRLTVGAKLHLATDWEDYAEQMLMAAEAEPRLRNVAGPGSYHSGQGGRPTTKFEGRGRRLGNEIRDIILERV